MKPALIYVGLVVVFTLLICVFFVGPSHARERERCASLGGEISSSGDCVKRGTLL